MPNQTGILGNAIDSAAKRPMAWLARPGLTARAIVYLVMGWLAILVGAGASGHVDQRGALTKVIARPFGTTLVILLAIGFAAYALWRLAEAAFGVSGEADGAGPRVKSLMRGIAYAALVVTSLSVLHGARGTAAGQQSHIAAGVMHHAGGRWIVGILGAVVVAAGLAMIREGWTKKFLRYFDHLPTRLRAWIVRLGQAGTVSRGVVFTIAGALVVLAAWKSDPRKAGGMDTAFRTLLAHHYGSTLVVALGVGLIIFGIYGLAEAAYRRV